MFVVALVCAKGRQYCPCLGFRYDRGKRLQDTSSTVNLQIHSRRRFLMSPSDSFKEKRNRNHRCFKRTGAEACESARRPFKSRHRHMSLNSLYIQACRLLCAPLAMKIMKENILWWKTVKWGTAIKTSRRVDKVVCCRGFIQACRSQELQFRRSRVSVFVGPSDRVLDSSFFDWTCVLSIWTASTKRRHPGPVNPWKCRFCSENRKTDQNGWHLEVMKKIGEFTVQTPSVVMALRCGMFWILRKNPASHYLATCVFGVKIFEVTLSAWIFQPFEATHLILEKKRLEVFARSSRKPFL